MMPIGIGNSVSQADGIRVPDNMGPAVSECGKLAGQPDPVRMTCGSQRRRQCPERQRLIGILSDP